MPTQISVISSVKVTYKEEFVANQLVEAQIDPPPLSPRTRHDLIDTIPSSTRRPAYPARPTAREPLEKHIQELIQLGVLRKIGHNEEVEVTAPVIIAWHNDKSRIFGDFRALNT
ncbi:hypothetical protein O181_093817 [Austropuccinia psidii MF-1]|uniref:Uncharacterized protein n=1 Tax=Austropuccinia psidii MF-1 TaxID=1389203 RepID=A0A9Q3J275_9BASI|nr:hypothetical protein [Austropuccinia psidii MF-1]